MNLNQIDLIVQNPAHAAEQIGSWTGIAPDVAETEFAQITLGQTVVMFSRTAMVDIAKAAGVILHIEVPDVSEATHRAVGHGAILLTGPVTTDWGTESALLQGPEGVIIDFYKAAG